MAALSNLEITLTNLLCNNCRAQGVKVWESYTPYIIFNVDLENENETIKVSLDVQKISWKNVAAGHYVAQALMSVSCPSCDDIHTLNYQLEAPRLLLTNIGKCKTCGSKIQVQNEEIEYSSNEGDKPIITIRADLICQECKSSEKKESFITFPRSASLITSERLDLFVNEQTNQFDLQHFEEVTNIRTGERSINFGRGLDLLKAQLEQTNRYIEFTTLEARLLENLHDERLYGGTESTRTERAKIVNSLNKLALEVLNLSFNDLALGRIPNRGQIPVGELSLVRQLKVAPSPNVIKPPVQTRLQDLPFNELSWEQFEGLCAALVQVQPVTVSCNLFGVQGDEQQGIDIVAKQRGTKGEEVWAYQCKRYKEYSSGKLKEALDKMAYTADYYVFMLSIPATAALRQVVDAHPKTFLWDSKDIARKLKNYPSIVEDFFGGAWCAAFCGQRGSS